MRRPLIREFRLLFFAILGVIVPFGLLLYFFPGEADSYWTWSIPEPRSAMLIGAAYLGAIFYYIAALYQNDWQQVDNGLGGLILFSLVLLAATMAHWDAFRPYHPITLVWLAFYYGGPFLAPVFYRLQIERMGPATDEGISLAPGVRAWLIGPGGFYAVVELVRCDRHPEQTGLAMAPAGGSTGRCDRGVSAYGVIDRFDTLSGVVAAG